MLPSISGNDAIEVFQILGYTHDETRDDYVILVYESTNPEHNDLLVQLVDQLSVTALKDLIRDSGFTEDEFLKAYDEWQDEA
jgi:hypothetical protein